MVARYYRELLNFLTLSTRNRDDAADVLQETYLRVLALQQARQPILEPRALLYRTARNIQIDQHRRRQVRRGEIHLEDEAGPFALEDIAAPEACQPEVALASTQTVDTVLATIEALPPRCREAFMLYKFDGLPQAEIAARMGISQKMVEQHVKNAMVACRLSIGAASATPTAPRRARARNE